MILQYDTISCNILQYHTIYCNILIVFHCYISIYCNVIVLWSEGKGIAYCNINSNTPKIGENLVLDCTATTLGGIWAYFDSNISIYCNILQYIA